MNSKEIADKMTSLKSRIAQLKVLEQETARLNPSREGVSREIDAAERAYADLSDRERDSLRFESSRGSRRQTKAEAEREQAEIHRRNLREQAAKKKSDRERYEEYLSNLRERTEKMKTKFDRFEEDFQASYRTPPTFRQPTGKSLRTGAGFAVYDSAPETQASRESGVVIYDPEAVYVRSRKEKESKDKQRFEEASKGYEEQAKLDKARFEKLKQPIPLDPEIFDLTKDSAYRSFEKRRFQDYREKMSLTPKKKGDSEIGLENPLSLKNLKLAFIVVCPV
ncbi:uncharacterized protein LOC116204110 [Punica granatum]|uniref:Uncharacterized protein LOC116204110 n=1 Tax=Punica granatum TaxID=22663 RepID=A0A6P8DF48_PUNGR|nr:uncharacterized protein LOC116204110 [Punica granatum]